MLLMRARVVPHITRARLWSPRGFTMTLSPSRETATSLSTGMLSSPSLPLARTRPPSIFTSTPAGTVTGFFPIRDMALPSPSRRVSIHPADDFAADVLVARDRVRHDALRRRNDGDAEPAMRACQLLDARIDAPARRRDALDLPNRRLALVIAEVDDGLAHARPDFLVGEAADVALFLEDAEHGGVQLRGRHGDLGLLRLLAVPDARNH